MDCKYLPENELKVSLEMKDLDLLIESIVLLVLE